MSNKTPQPQKKGLHPLAWVGIGCGVILVIVVVVMMVGGFFLARAVKDVAGDFEDNPGLAAARLIVKASPELEEVDVDEDAGTMTVRNKKTGELVTVNLEDIEQGKLSWTGENGEGVTVDVSEAESGTVKVESSDGEGFQLTTGAAVTQDRPDWAPVYPGTEPKDVGTLTTDDSAHGSFSLQTSDSVAEVRDFYSEMLKEAGFEVNVNTFSGGGTEGAMVNASLEAENKNVIVMINREDGEATEIGVTYTERK
ncbi:MAG: hypothetical protein V2I67_11290 [Thermoanaerobaculales bacterium]|jgi:hypothetical protein|nr:hypothetical protein [Thermoanaerobaculales bacterium]